MAAAPMSVGPYALLEPLGRGGWAEVFRARAPGGREVALKRPLPGVALSRERAARFRREGDVVRALDDPGIVRLLDAGEEGGRPWLAYELVYGARLLDAAMAAAPTRERVRLVRDAARALGAAHAQGVVHRDVTPANVLVDAAGRVRVADFGLASMAGLDPLTASGVVVGTPGFLAPELGLAGRDATSPRCDVWSLGVLLFVALTGRHPFQGVSFYDLVQRASTAPPSPRSVRPSVCADLDRACAAALAVDPGARPLDGAAFAALLGPCLARPCLDDGPGGPPPLQVAGSGSGSDPGARMPPAPTTVAAPVRFGRYTSKGQLGQGGMGTVYRAHDPQLGRDVAVKVLDEARVSQTDRARFAREAQAAATVRHPNLVAVHEAGLAEGRPYLVMDLVDGESLDDRLTRGPLPAREAAQLLAPVARALAALHAARIIHRDVKPANILVDRDGAPRLTDFGLAKLLDERERLTRSQQVLGTALFMAPEQWGRAAVDERTDVYALGVTLYALLTGNAPDADAESLQVLMARRLAGPPAPPSSLAPGVPPDLDRIALACQAVEPAERFASAGALAAALEAFLAGERVDTPRTPRRAPTSARVAATVGLLVVVAVVTVVARGGRGGGPSVEPGAAARQTLTAILASTGRLAAVSTDALAALRAAPAGPQGDEARALAGLVTLARGSPELAATFLPPPDRSAGPVAQGLRGALLAARPDGDPALAARDLGAALDAGVRPVDLRAWRARARARGALDAALAAEVLRDLEAAAQAGGAGPEEETARCVALLAAQRVDEARAALLRLQDPPPDLAGRVGLALAARELAAGDAVRALAALALGPLPGDAPAVGALHAQAARVAGALLGRWTSVPPPSAEVEQVLAALALTARLRPADPYPPDLRRSLLAELSRYDREVPGLLFPTVAQAAPPDAALCLVAVRTAVGVEDAARGVYLPALERLLTLGVPPDEWFTVAYMHAETLLVVGRHADAVAACDRAQGRSDADDAGRLRFLRGKARLGLGQHAEALADFDGVVIRTNMGRSDLAVWRAEALLGLGRRHEAFDAALAFVRATVVDSSNVGGVPGLGRAAALLWSCKRDDAGRLPDLRWALERVLQVNPGWGCWELRLALLELEAGEVARARARLSALEADPALAGDRAQARDLVRTSGLVEAIGVDPAAAVVHLTHVTDRLDRSWGPGFHP